MPHSEYELKQALLANVRRFLSERGGDSSPDPRAAVARLPVKIDELEKSDKLLPDKATSQATKDRERLPAQLILPTEVDSNLEIVFFLL